MHSVFEPLSAEKITSDVAHLTLTLAEVVLPPTEILVTVWVLHSSAAVPFTLQPLTSENSSVFVKHFSVTVG
jgi:hypothetical protein